MESPLARYYPGKRHTEVLAYDARHVPAFDHLKGMLFAPRHHDTIALVGSENCCDRLFSE
jgi:hypothetical protein